MDDISESDYLSIVTFSDDAIVVLKKTKMIAQNKVSEIIFNKCQNDCASISYYAHLIAFLTNFAI